MIRLLLHLLKVKDYENCKSCETLKQQLDLANHEKRELTETLLQIMKPTIVAPAPELKVSRPIEAVGGTFGRRRSILENMHKTQKEITRNSPFIAKPDTGPREITTESINDMETKLGLSEEDKTNAD